MCWVILLGCCVSAVLLASVLSFAAFILSSRISRREE